MLVLLVQVQLQSCCCGSLVYVEGLLLKSARPPQLKACVACARAQVPSSGMQSAHCPVGWLQPCLRGKVLCREKYVAATLLLVNLVWEPINSGLFPRS